jgi:MacB-like periplasmic core domain
MFTAIESWWQDFRYAARTLAKSKGVTATAVIALALGIGINTTVFSVICEALNIDLGVKQVERLLVINVESANRNEIAATLPELRSVRLKSIDLVAAYRISPMNVSDGNHLPERYWGAQMTASGFEMLSRQPALGRVFSDRDEQVAVIRHRMWQDRYGNDAAIVGRTIRADDTPRRRMSICGFRSIRARRIQWEFWRGSRRVQRSARRARKLNRSRGR